MDTSVYTFEDKDGNEDLFYTQNYDIARAYASKNKLKLIENTYVWEDSNLLEDYTDKHTYRCRSRGGDYETVELIDREEAIEFAQDHNLLLFEIDERGDETLIEDYTEE